MPTTPATYPPGSPRIPYVLARLCDQLKTTYYQCKRNGDNTGALAAYIRLHEIEDGY
jgi:hypothetical protein